MCIRDSFLTSHLFSRFQQYLVIIRSYAIWNKKGSVYDCDCCLHVETPTAGRSGELLFHSHSLAAELESIFAPWSRCLADSGLLDESGRQHLQLGSTCRCHLLLFKISIRIIGQTITSHTRHSSYKMSSASTGQKLSREDWRKKKELEEARKAGTAPAEVDEEGRYTGRKINYS